MVFLKKVEIKDAIEKYGFSHIGVFAQEAIKKGEIVKKCDINKCDYNGQILKTKDELFEFCNANPDFKDYISRYTFPIDDDLFNLPSGYLEKKLTDSCAFMNHSCNPNCGFKYLNDDDEWSVVQAIKDIEPGEEITFDYQLLAIAPDIDANFDCKCGSYNCRGIISYEEYRNIDWQYQNYKYCTSYVKKRIDELKTKWYSSRCYLKYNKNDLTKELCLTTHKKIAKDFLVAIFSDKTNINSSAHYIRHSDKPTCYLVENEVYTLNDYEPNTEITLNYTKT